MSVRTDYFANMMPRPKMKVSEPVRDHMRRACRPHREATLLRQCMRILGGRSRLSFFWTTPVGGTFDKMALCEVCLPVAAPAGLRRIRRSDGEVVLALRNL